MKSLEKTIEEVALRLPKLPPKPRKNLYDIMGIQNKETINSRVLAYFLDANEDHGFGELFFESLKEIVGEKLKDKTFPDFDVDILNGSYRVLTEDTTTRANNDDQKQKRIDVSIEGTNWCIIIENKIYHNLDNPLKTYWEHAKSNYPINVLGLILSINKVSHNRIIRIDGGWYLNITHKELIKQVQKNLIIGTQTNDTSLFYLKEYFKTMESHYKAKTDEPKMNEIVKTVQNHGKEVREINNKVNKAISFIDSEIKEVFNTFGFEKNGGWYTCSEKHPDLYFWIHETEKIVLDNYLWFCFEIRNESNKNIDIDKLNLFKKDLPGPQFLSFEAKKAKSRTHIAKFNGVKFLKDGGNFKDTFKKVLEGFFMAENEGIVDKTVAFLENQPSTPIE